MHSTGAMNRERGKTAENGVGRIGIGSMERSHGADRAAAQSMSKHYESVETAIQRRRRGRMLVVAAGLSLIACMLITVRLGEDMWGEEDHGQRRVGLLSAGQSDEEIRTADEQHCERFEGFLKTECIEKRRQDRNAPRLWTDEEVRNGLWETEKALADLLVRQYKRSKEREELHEVMFLKMMILALEIVVALWDCADERGDI